MTAPTPNERAEYVLSELSTRLAKREELLPDTSLWLYVEIAYQIEHALLDKCDTCIESVEDILFSP